MSRAWILLGWLATVAVGGSTVFDLETTRATGDPILLELAPRDPRSLVQGDFMRLNTLVSRYANHHRDGQAPHGQVVLQVDPDGVGHFVRFHDGEALEDHEHLMDYRTVHGRIQVGTRSYLFQEGTAERYADARYGRYRVRPSGRALLVGLSDENRQALGPKTQ